MRWQFGVVIPREYTAAGTGEPFAQQTEILLEPQGAPVVSVLLRFLHVVSRRVEVCVEASFEPVESLEIDGTSYVTFDETVERQAALRVRPLEAPQSLDGIAFEGQIDDATEIDELLKLSVLSLSDAERQEARATDPRAKAIVERAEGLDARGLERIHSGSMTADPFADLDVPSIDCVFVNGTKVAKGSAVRLQPKRRADVMDTFLVGKPAMVRAIHQDLENQLYVAVTIDDDPASDLHEWYGRSFFFYPDEIEPL